MSRRAANDEKLQAYLKLMGNPYASLSIYDEPAEAPSKQMTLEEKRSRFRQMQNPYAYSYFFGDPEDGEGVPGTLSQARLELDDQPNRVAESGIASRVDVERELNEVLHLYRPYVARNEWARVMDYRTEFLDRVDWTTSRSARVVSGIKKLKFALMPGEKVEFNRAPAERIIGELKRLLT